MPRPSTGMIRWLLRPPSAAAAGRVFCIPHAGCGTNVFARWPAELDLAIYLDVLRVNIEVSRRYVVPDPPRPGCPVTAIGWSDDAEVPPRDMAGWSRCGIPRSWSFRAAITRSSRFRPRC